MVKISGKTLQDLEFNTILGIITSYSISNLGRNAVKAIVPFDNKKDLLFELHLVNEYLSSFQNENRIPNHHFEEITKDIQLLKIEDSFLEPASFLNIASVSTTVNDLLRFFKKFKEYYSNLYNLSENIK